MWFVDVEETCECEPSDTLQRQIEERAVDEYESLKYEGLNDGPDPDEAYDRWREEQFEFEQPELTAWDRI